MTIAHPDYVGSEIAISNLHSNTTKSFSETMTEMFEYVNQRNGQYAPLIADDVQSNSRKMLSFRLTYHLQQRF
jgi:ribonucleoside-diphosphate reductase alpha chain